MSTEKTVLNQSRSVQNSRRRNGCRSYGNRRSRAIIRNAQRTMRAVGSKPPGVISVRRAAQQISSPPVQACLDVDLTWGLCAGERGGVSFDDPPVPPSRSARRCGGGGRPGSVPRTRTFRGSTRGSPSAGLASPDRPAPLRQRPGHGALLGDGGRSASGSAGALVARSPRVDLGLAARRRSSRGPLRSRCRWPGGCSGSDRARCGCMPRSARGRSVACRGCSSSAARPTRPGRCSRSPGRSPRSRPGSRPTTRTGRTTWCSSRSAWFEPAIHGHKRRGICADELNARGLRIDLGAERNDYDLWVCPNDAVIPLGLSGTPLGPGPGRHHGAAQLAHLGLAIHPADAAGAGHHRRVRAHASATRSSASPARGTGSSSSPRASRLEKLVVTGIPNFDDFARFSDNDFPHHGYVLVCTSDGRETMMAVDRPALLERSVQIAAGRQLIFKLHPNENVERATREILADRADRTGLRRRERRGDGGQLRRAHHRAQLAHLLRSRPGQGGPHQPPAGTGRGADSRYRTGALPRRSRT